MMGAAQGFPVTLCMPQNVSEERKRIIRAYGAEIIFTDAAEGSDGAIRKARELAAAEPAEILLRRPVLERRQLARALQHDRGRDLAADRRPRDPLRRHARHQRHLRRHVAQAEGAESPRSLHLGATGFAFHGIEGAKHMASSIVPRIYDPTVADEELWVSTEEAYAVLKRLAREEGVAGGHFRRGCDGRMPAPGRERRSAAPSS